MLLSLKLCRRDPHFVLSYPHKTNSTETFMSVDTGSPRQRLMVVCVLALIIQ